MNTTPSYQPWPRPLPPESDTAPIVLWFAGEMEHKLSLNRHQGDRAGWRVCEPVRMLRRLREQAIKLESAMMTFSPDEIISEAADVANFAMMIADLARDSRVDDPLVGNSP